MIGDFAEKRALADDAVWKFPGNLSEQEVAASSATAKPGITGDKCEVIDDCVNGKYKKTAREKRASAFTTRKEEKGSCASVPAIPSTYDRENISWQRSDLCTALAELLLFKVLPQLHAQLSY
ncbi:hypothetical protein CEXT_420211, partial [Caerostris extrusa]